MNSEEFLSDRVKEVANSLLWEFFDLARRTPDVISLSVGEPDFQTPWHISEECIYNIKKGRTYYAPTRGLHQLREGILNYYGRRFGVWDYECSNCLVTVGASESIDLIARAVLNPGDECIIIDPGYVAYEPAVILNGAKPIYLQVKESEGFKVTPENLLSCISDRTKMIILNYPSNPTGGIMTREDYEKIIPVLKEHHILIVADEIYLELTYDQKAVSMGCFKEIRDQLVLVNGFSKAYSMTGWRLGYMLAPTAIITACNNIHQYSTMGPMTPAQFAAIEAISSRSDKDIQKHCESFKIRRNFLTAQLNKIGLHTPMPEGAFYVFANITSSGLKSYEFCAKLLEEQKVCIIPGTAFGPSGEGYARISYAYSLDQLKLAVERIGIFLQVHHV
ncbi:MAG: pyridoxal phosphate-dependent aminotransferase [Erysipelotrichia bacterium]|nr:pyridoxal phosphate-dependent aminotransferase [Erysipelotrichia bacterium]